MADVSVIVKIMPENAEINLDELENKLKEKVKPYKIARKPIAFGLNAIILTIIMEEAAGGTDSLEKTINGIAGVGEVTVESVSRTLG